MTHTEWIKKEFNVLAERENGILFEAYGEVCCEINGAQFAFTTIDEFNDACDLFGDDDFSEQFLDHEQMFVVGPGGKNKCSFLPGALQCGEVIKW